MYRLIIVWHRIPFPCALEDCYTVAREIFLDTALFDVETENIILIGDSAGANWQQRYLCWQETV